MNSAACNIHSSSMFSHINIPPLTRLHWLKAKEWTDSKVVFSSTGVNTDPRHLTSLMNSVVRRTCDAKVVFVVHRHHCWSSVITAGRPSALLLLFKSLRLVSWLTCSLSRLLKLFCSVPLRLFSPLLTLQSNVYVLYECNNLGLSDFSYMNWIRVCLSHFKIAL